MYDPTVGRFLSEDPIDFESGDANKYRYVGNSPTTFVDSDGMQRQKPSTGTSGRSAQNSANAGNRATAAIEERKRLFYLRALMQEFLVVGSAYLWRKSEAKGYSFDPCEIGEGFSEADYLSVADHIRYAYDKSNAGSVNVWNASSQNFAFLPGVAIDQEAFYGVDETALAVLIHEWAHNFTREGMGIPNPQDWTGHNTKWFNGVSINDLFGPYSDDNAFSRLVDYFRRTKCDNGSSIWQQMKINATSRAAQMMIDADAAASSAWESHLRARRGYGSRGPGND